MAQLHLAIAYRGKNREDRPHVIYCGHDADACQRAIDGALQGGVFVRVERYRPAGPIVKHSDLVGIGEADEAEAEAPEANAESAPAEPPVKKAGSKKLKPDPESTPG